MAHRWRGCSALRPLALPSEQAARLTAIGAQASPAILARLWQMLLKAHEEVRTAPQPVAARFPIGTTSRGILAWPVRSENAAASDAAFVADMRRASARYPRDRRLASFLERTIAGNARFAGLWRLGGVAGHAGDRKTIEHPAVGELTLDCDVLHAGDADLRIVALTAAPGSEDALRLERARAATPPERAGRA